jgi:hypothetical protein
MSAERRAARLMRCYPRAWRRRYGEEFAALLVAEFGERPRSISRTLDVVCRGLLARVRTAGLAGPALERERQLRASLGALAGAVAVFAVAGAALWSQLTIGWQWSAPASGATRTGMLLMTAAVCAIVAVALLAVAPIVWSLGRALVSGQASALAGGLALAAAGTAVLIAGSVHFGHGWPGTGGHAWGGRGIVPGTVARIAWAATLWISAYWAHPGALSAFPAGEIGWMVLAPLALVAVAVGAGRVLRTLPLSRRVLGYEARLGLAAAVAMAVFLAGGGSWIVSGGAAPRGLFAVGAIDVAGLVVLAVALLVGCRAVQRIGLRGVAG